MSGLVAGRWRNPGTKDKVQLAPYQTASGVSRAACPHARLPLLEADSSLSSTEFKMSG